eukprot:1184304-Prorocentrum_minimum.AAC.1
MCFIKYASPSLGSCEASKKEPPTISTPGGTLPAAFDTRCPQVHLVSANQDSPGSMLGVKNSSRTRTCVRTFKQAQVGGTSQHASYLCRVHHLGLVKAECTHASVRRLEGSGDRTLAAANIHHCLPLRYSTRPIVQYKLTVLARVLVQRGVHHLGVCTPACAVSGSSRGARASYLYFDVAACAELREYCSWRGLNSGTNVEQVVTFNAPQCAVKVSVTMPNSGAENTDMNSAKFAKFSGFLAQCVQMLPPVPMAATSGLAGSLPATAAGRNNNASHSAFSFQTFTPVERLGWGRPARTHATFNAGRVSEGSLI